MPARWNRLGNRLGGRSRSTRRASPCSGTPSPSKPRRPHTHGSTARTKCSGGSPHCSTTSTTRCTRRSTSTRRTARPSSARRATRTRSSTPSSPTPNTSAYRATRSSRRRSLPATSCPASFTRAPSSGPPAWRDSAEIRPQEAQAAVVRIGCASRGRLQRAGGLGVELDDHIRVVVEALKPISKARPTRQRLTSRCRSSRSSTSRTKRARGCARELAHDDAAVLRSVTARQDPPAAGTRRVESDRAASPPRRTARAALHRAAVSAARAHSDGCRARP